MSISPGILAQTLVLASPQCLYLTAAPAKALSGFLNLWTNQDMQNLVQWLEDNPTEFDRLGAVLAPPGPPGTASVVLEQGILAPLASVIRSASAWIAGNERFRDIGWTEQFATVPGPIPPAPNDGNWTLDQLPPRGGLVFANLAFTDGQTPSFSLTLVNDQPRHLAAYVTFLKHGSPVTPAGWSSRLPTGTPDNFETDQLKFLAVLPPDTAVAGLPAGTGGTTLSLPLPANADAMELTFGGLGLGSAQPQPQAAGLMLTALFDNFIPWLVAVSGQKAASLDDWLTGLGRDPTYQGAALGAGAFLLKPASAPLPTLANDMTGAVLAPCLESLQQEIDRKLGLDKNGHSWVSRLAPAAGWTAQLMSAVLQGGVCPTYWAAGTPAGITLNLAPATALAVDLAVTPDPGSGAWPFAGHRISARLNYGSGYSQTLQLAVPAQGTNARFDFGVVQDLGRIDIAVDLTDSGDQPLASGTATLTPDAAAGQRTLASRLAVTNVPTLVSNKTSYSSHAVLAFDNGRFSWDSSADSARPWRLAKATIGTPALTRLCQLTLQASRHALGYAWAAQDQQVETCGGGARIRDAYFLQVIGSVLPPGELQAMDCGLTTASLWAFGADNASGYLLDSTAGGNGYLRPHDFTSSPIRFSQDSVGKLPADDGVVDLCLHPEGYAAAVSSAGGLLQISALARHAGPDHDAPRALGFGGSGQRIGLLNNPVAVDTLQNGCLAVLEAGAARVQAFDIHGAPAKCFAGQSFFNISAMQEPVALDLAVSPSGLIHILVREKQPTRSEDFVLQVYRADGSWLTQTAGVAAARIAVDSDETLYTLDFATISGPDGRLQPRLSVWTPN